MTQVSNHLIGAAIVGFTLTSSMAALAAPSGTVAFLMPDQASTRYEQHDFPGFKAEMAKLCPDCKVLYQNANADASQQQQQFNSVISQGAKVIVLDSVDSTAAASLVHMAQSQGIKVIAYDRPVPSTPADYYVSFDNEEIGKSIAQSLVAQLKESGVAGSKGGVLEMVNPLNCGKYAYRAGPGRNPWQAWCFTKRIDLSNNFRRKNSAVFH